MSTEPTNILRALAEDYRQIAKKGTIAAMSAVKAELFEGIPQNDGAPERALSYNPAHSGDTPEPIDAVATAAAEDVVRTELRARGIHDREILSAGEEAGNGTHLVKPETYLHRSDSLDGSTSALARLLGHSSVCAIDRSRSDGTARHYAGAIYNSSGWLVSWEHYSARNVARGSYPRLAGAVFISNPAWDLPEIELTAIRWDRREATLAAVAHNQSRRAGVEAIADRLGIAHDSAFWTAGGTPLAPALLCGQIGALIEPNAVSLHDSLLLLPYQLLGGEILTPVGDPMDYMHIYEANALDMNPGARPVKGYVARVR